MKITAPNPTYSGRIGDVQFRNGVASTDNPAVISYCRGAGYTIDDEVVEQPAGAAPVDSRDVECIQLGTPLRDAAVDPHPGDFKAPTNAGAADPHSPHVVSARPGWPPIIPAPLPASV
ncbi:hypothetical protein [Streptosporangium roseum]|uniref:Uncharacterized protein n=1 Tax=Streptosporangium roseum (strain ATCC 12428 / DSM 43021 / JCM 3005 / KCTC 9067 / NCIMB 10171 / NRRL 2505 / NI 9100) TaxID=479432 RepID=D2AUH7_STRRD|nr:hypothetical protein [Streptosporangium roseum]ACZ84839.1 hypothetical protein Sros_1851 [Streptosporangium roseum DSM 43021]